MAEGLIPYIYRAIKRMRRERKYYRSLSTGQSNWFGPPSSHPEVLRPPAIKLGSFSEGRAGGNSGRNGRYSSMQDFYVAADDAFSPKSSGRRPAIKLGGFSEGTAGGNSGRHRRYSSMQDFYAAADDAFSPKISGRRPAKEMAKFGSSRSSRVFSCITGVN